MYPDESRVMNGFFGLRGCPETVAVASVPHVMVVPLIVPRRTKTVLEFVAESPATYTIFVAPVSWYHADIFTMLAVENAVFFVFTQDSPSALGSYEIVEPS